MRFRECLHWKSGFREPLALGNPMHIEETTTYHWLGDKGQANALRPTLPLLCGTHKELACDYPLKADLLHTGGQQRAEP